MTSTPQPLTVRRGGAKRGDHGSYVGSLTPPEAPAAETPGPEVSELSIRISPDRTRSGVAGEDRSQRPAVSSQSDAGARAKAAYDAKPKVIFRGVDHDTVDRLKAMYRDQLHKPGGIEGWSEWGRTLLEQIVDHYEEANGPLLGGRDIQLRPGRVAGTAQ